MDFELAGIPIDEEQCIGDSLPYINGAFATLSANLRELDSSIFALYLPRSEFGGFLPITGGTLVGPLNIGQNNVVNSSAKIILGKTVAASEPGLPQIYCGSANNTSADLYIRSSSASSKIIFGTGLDSSERMRVTNLGIGVNTSRDPETGLQMEVNGLLGIKTDSAGNGLFVSKIGSNAISNYDRMELRLSMTEAIAYIGTNNYGTGPARAVSFVTQGLDRMRITTDGNIGIGTATPLKRLHVNGDSLISGNLDVTGVLTVNGQVVTTGNVTAFSNSDARLKTNVVPISGALDKVSAIGGYNFEWRTDVNIPARGKDVGVIAQEVELVLPEVVLTNADNYKTVRYDKIIPLLIEAIKELSLKAAQS
jgi:hypothetical protein